MREDIERLSKIYAAALDINGVTLGGALWPNAADLASRYETLLQPIEFEHYRSERRVRLLDLGCGPGFLLDYLAENDLIDRVDYLGVDVIDATLRHARARWPAHRFELREVRDDPFGIDEFDYCIVCGAFTSKFDASFAVMETLVRETLAAVWPSVSLGLGFNVMSKHVDWERGDLFHWPLDDIAAFCKSRLSRHVALRLDFGTWDVSVTVRKEPAPRHGGVPRQWLGQGDYRKIRGEADLIDPLTPAAYEAALARNRSEADRALRELDAAMRAADDHPSGPEKIERLRVMRTIRASGLFDDGFDLASNPNVARAGSNALDHYVRYGDAQGRQPNPIFSPREYRELTRPRLPAESNALQHYIEEGEAAGFNASRLFKPGSYFDANPPLEGFVDRPLFHYLKIGRPAGLAVRPAGLPANGTASAAHRRPDLRIAAYLGVKDEVEIIEPAIAHLRAIGVDHIIVCDVDSTDGTAAVLERYRSDDFQIMNLSDDEIWNYPDGGWPRELDLIKSAPADWILFIDADEFCIPASGNLKDCEALAIADALILPRFNIPPGTEEPLIRGTISPARYDELLLIAEGIPDFNSYLRRNPGTPWILGQDGPKIMARRECIGGWAAGSHDLLAADDQPLRWAKPADLLIAHLPLTTRSRFARKIDNIRKLMADEDEERLTGDAVFAGIAWHWRYWLSLARQGRLDEAFDRNVFDAATLADLRRRGIVQPAATVLHRLGKRLL